MRNKGLNGYRALMTVIVAGLLLLLSGCESSNIQYNKQGYASRFGVMSLGPDGKYHVYAETTQIHRHVSQDYAHGFEVKRRDNGRFMGYFEVRFPEPIEISPELEKHYTVLEGGRVIRSESELHWGLYSSPFWFSEDDPLGQYELSIYIDGELYRTIQYDVVPFESGLPF
ncbi:hypothetical protein [Pelagicoccus sp. SDUM812003]|uniref:hypothetical protein n=1 Tax=Pelagicoccus sp. SDUM812003 TaxID=3041267 RepID=UPI00280D4D04|nr:hypothetical protein [Pelagicoccus sp. SDUM812003]MDQ8204578.1 hypothetical protein [Pelagicoccus sp. SDUM812003]